jgi:large subunit ribosomal protein L2
MGKRLVQQRRGKGTPTYRSPSHKHVSDVKHHAIDHASGTVLDLVHAPGRNCPLAAVNFDGDVVHMIASEGMQVGQEVKMGVGAPIYSGNTLPLAGVPEGTPVYNVEGRPGDGGKFVRTAGTSATFVSRGKKVVILMPSGEFKTLDPQCKATVGIVAGGGQKEKPFGKAGDKYHAYKSKAKAHFKVRGVAMNPVDHPHGGGSHQHVGKPSTVGRNAPPGRKVGRLSPKKRKTKRK